MHLETGFVGNTSLTYKSVETGDMDIVPMRMLWRNKK